MPRLTRLLALVAAAAVPVLGLAGPQLAAAPAAASEQTVNSVRLNGYEAKLVAQVNSARSKHGLRPLVVTAGSSDVARAWSWRLARAQSLSHNPALVHDMSTHGSSAWTMVAENVGEAPADDPAALFQAYMASPPHRANILDRKARYLGIGVVQRGSTAWNTLDFTDAYNTGYGRTRVPPAAMTTDEQRITAPTDVAGVETPDQRFGTQRAGSVHVTMAHFSGPTAANDRVSASFSRHGSSGHADLLMRTPLQLSQAHTLSLQLAAYDPDHRALPVTVVLGRSFSGQVTLGTVRVGARAGWYTFTLPATARSYRDSLALRVDSAGLHSVGGRAKVAVFDVRASA